MIDRRALEIIKVSEGLRLVAYVCPAGVLTIGYGHTGKDVRVGMRITEAEADELLLTDIKKFVEGVTKLVKVPLTEAQRGALVSFAFNLGLGNLSSSTLLKKLNAGDYKGAADEFTKWNKAGGKVLAGLTKRRHAERELFLST